MIRNKLAKVIEQAAIQAQKQDSLKFASLPVVTVEHPQNPEHGDYASSLPLKLAKSTGLAPNIIAEKIIEFIPQLNEVSQISIAHPGFINITLNQDWLMQQVQEILDIVDSWGTIDLGKGEYIQIEFVSVNPTGPLHIGHGRGAVIGSTLSNVLSMAGYKVEKEYYINDAGSQLDSFSRSLLARYKQCLGIDVELPQDGYVGHYMIDMAKEIAKDEGDRFLKLSEASAIQEIGALGMKIVLEIIKQDLELMGIEFDVWFSEQSMFNAGLHKKVIDLLREKGYVIEKEGATWFKSTSLGEDKDNVLVRSDGSPTYFASDISYHFNKFLDRKFGTVIDIWGADHHGHVSRMKTVVTALGIDPDRLKIIICQLVTLRRGKDIVKVSKRSGDLITVREVVDEVGSDACRFVFLSRSADSQMDFDLELAKKQSADNPVYYVQYAHARIASILRLAEDRDIDYRSGEVGLLKTEPELSLIRQILLLPEIVETVATTLEPHHLPYYAQELATVFHSFYKQCRVISDDHKLTASRLKLVKVAQITLAKTLYLMGMTAPETM
jgi:arginyl-tRNA synthetase